MSGIFISYRRVDAKTTARLVYECLAKEFGADFVFYDVEGIEGGDNFARVLGERVAACTALVALIGEGWLEAKDLKGQRRLDLREDFVRKEIATAFEQDKPVISVLLEGAQMPDRSSLPPELVGLAAEQSIPLTNSHFDFDIGQLIDAIKKKGVCKRRKTLSEYFIELRSSLRAHSGLRGILWLALLVVAVLFLPSLTPAVVSVAVWLPNALVRVLVFVGISAVAFIIIIFSAVTAISMGYLLLRALTFGRLPPLDSFSGGDPIPKVPRYLILATIMGCSLFLGYLVATDPNPIARLKNGGVVVQLLTIWGALIGAKAWLKNFYPRVYERLKDIRARSGITLANNFGKAIWQVAYWFQPLAALFLLFLLVCAYLGPYFVTPFLNTVIAVSGALAMFLLGFYFWYSTYGLYGSYHTKVAAHDNPLKKNLFLKYVTVFLLAIVTLGVGLVVGDGDSSPMPAYLTDHAEIHILSPVNLFEKETMNRDPDPGRPEDDFEAFPKLSTQLQDGLRLSGFESIPIFGRSIVRGSPYRWERFNRTLSRSGEMWADLVSNTLNIKLRPSDYENKAKRFAFHGSIAWKLSRSMNLPPGARGGELLTELKKHAEIRDGLALFSSSQVALLGWAFSRPSSARQAEPTFGLVLSTHDKDGAPWALLTLSDKGTFRRECSLGLISPALPGFCEICCLH